LSRCAVAIGLCFCAGVRTSPFLRTVSDTSRKYANGVRNSNRMVPSGSMITRSTMWRSNSFWLLRSRVLYTIPTCAIDCQRLCPDFDVYFMPRLK